MTIARRPELGKLLERAAATAAMNMHVAMVAQVQAYEPQNADLGGLATVDVRPCVDRTLIEEDREQDDTFPVLSCVPVIFPGSGNYRLTFPIAKGDYVLLVFCDRSTDEFIANGGVNVPQDQRTHHISDAFAIPGVLPSPNALQALATNVMVLGKNGNPHQPAARKNDQITLAAGTVINASATGVVQGSSPNLVITLSNDVTGTISSGSSDVEIT